MKRDDDTRNERPVREKEERKQKTREGFWPVVSRFIQAYSSKVSVSFFRIAYEACEAFAVSLYLQQK